LPRDWPIGSLLTGWAVSDIEKARARFGRSCGTARTGDGDAKGDGQVGVVPTRLRVPMRRTWAARVLDALSLAQVFGDD